MPTTLHTDQVRELLADNPRTRLIDVRTPGEFSASHIPGSYNVPLDLLKEHRAELNAEHSDPLVLVCASGARADQARSALEEAGLNNLNVLQGGINAWEQENAPVVRGSGTWSMERQVRLTAGLLVLTGVVASTVVEPLKWIAGFVGAGLTFAAVTNTCAMSRVLGLLPHNRVQRDLGPKLLSALTSEEKPKASATK